MGYGCVSLFARSWQNQLKVMVTRLKSDYSGVEIYLSAYAEAHEPDAINDGEACGD